MQPDQWERAAALFEEALALSPSERAPFLEDACRGDETLLKEVNVLLRSNNQAQRFFDRLEGRVAAVLGSRLSDDTPQDSRIGTYRLIRTLGRGGMGMVYLAQNDAEPGSPPVALKVLRSELDAEDFHNRFLSERQILSSLDHPNIARLLGGGLSEHNQPYFVMEYVEGVPVDHYCDVCNLSILERLKLFARCAAAVQHAHERFIVHRDLKPSNILVEAEAGVKLLDFGIAKIVSPGAEQVKTRTGLRLMTVEYAAPEQLRSGSITRATDTYQLGAILYKLITGQTPFASTSRDPLQLEMAILTQVPQKPSITAAKNRAHMAGDSASPSASGLSLRPHPSDLPNHLVPGLDAVVLKALSKDPAQRYSTASAFLDDVERCIAGVAPLAKPRSIAEKVRRTFLRRT